MAIFQLNKEKAPGPDGFTIAVYQECWDVIKEDLMRVFLEFHTKGPISLVTSLYKIIAKVLSGRLGKVLHETISGSQGAFVEGRQILDVVLIANEVVDEKRRKGFSQKWRSWIRGCLSSSSFAILVNGNAKGWVKAFRGLRQGDPLSPFLFTLVADVLSRLMIRAEETGITEGFFVGRNRTRVSLLQFADDTIFFSKASMEHLQNLKIIILVFGQSVRVAFVLFRPSIGREPKTIGFWDPVVERISRRLDGKKDHLIRWEVVSRSKELGGLGFGKTSMRNNALLGKWLWSSLEKGVVFGIRLLRVYMGHILMDGTPTWWLDGHTDVHGRLLLKFSRFKSVVFVFVRIVFSEIFFLGLVKCVKSYLVPSGQVLVEFKSPFKGLVWFPPRSVEDMMVITFKGLGNSLRGKTLWQIACLTLIWLVWQERNNRIFEDKGRTEEMLWDLIRFYSSLWASCTEAFRGVPLSVLQLNWIAVYASKV
ncbi:putative mitochondrial protein [Vitis vinifera]|uniref:Putative mitochondrial protein n=1 Tax=Vitis vinifera TaxID=29760 RepID=A0A438DLR0_VITVI|nr:putative mitochondrial protein [Vitis vinifera]